MTLREQVAQALTPWMNPQQNSGPVGMYEQRVAEEATRAADAAIRVVLATLAEQIEALRVPDETPWRVLDEVLALLRGAGGAASASGRVVDTGGAGAP